MKTNEEVREIEDLIKTLWIKECYPMLDEKGEVVVDKASGKRLYNVIDGECLVSKKVAEIFYSWHNDKLSSLQQENEALKAELAEVKEHLKAELDVVVMQDAELAMVRAVGVEDIEKIIIKHIQYVHINTLAEGRGVIGDVDNLAQAIHALYNQKSIQDERGE